MKEKIKQLEDRIKELHYNPVINKERFNSAETKELYSNFWDYHVAYVIKKSKEMAKKYNADLKVVWLAAMLHDISRLGDDEPHDETGSKKAHALLIEKKFDKKIADEVRNCILTHRCREYPPETLEQKILASADAISHFATPFYIWVAKDFKSSMEDLLEFNLKKLERDWNKKIFFEDEKKEIRKEYEVLKKWCEYRIQ